MEENTQIGDVVSDGQRSYLVSDMFDKGPWLAGLVGRMVAGKVELLGNGIREWAEFGNRFKKVDHVDLSDVSDAARVGGNGFVDELLEKAPKLRQYYVPPAGQ